MPEEQWAIHIHRTVVKVVYPLPKRWAVAILSAISALSENPVPSGARQIEDLDNTYELIVEGYRLVYQVQEEKKRIKIAMINLSLSED